MKYLLKSSYHDSLPFVSFRLSSFFGIIRLKANLDKDFNADAAIFLFGIKAMDLLAKSKSKKTLEISFEDEPEAPGLDKSSGSGMEQGSKQGIRENAGLILSMLRDERQKKDISRIKKWALSLLRRLTPKKGSLRASVGLSDPFATAKVCEIYSCLMPILGEHVVLIPDFSSEVIDIDCDIRGRFGLIPILYLSIRIFILGAKIWKKTKRSGSQRMALAST